MRERLSLGIGSVNLRFETFSRFENLSVCLPFFPLTCSTGVAYFDIPFGFSLGVEQLF
jgi:hypothetical protein